MSFVMSASGISLQNFLLGQGWTEKSPTEGIAVVGYGLGAMIVTITPVGAAFRVGSRIMSAGDPTTVQNAVENWLGIQQDRINSTKQN